MCIVYAEPDGDKLGVASLRISSRSLTARFSRIIGWYEVGERDVGGATDGPGAGGRKNSEIPGSGPVMTLFRRVGALVRVTLGGLVIPMGPTGRARVPIFPPGLK